MTKLLNLDQTTNQNQITKLKTINIYKPQMNTIKTQYIAPHQRKRLSRYKLKKQTSVIEQILSDAQILNV